MLSLVSLMNVKSAFMPYISSLVCLKLDRIGKYITHSSQLIYGLVKQLGWMTEKKTISYPLFCFIVIML